MLQKKELRAGTPPAEVTMLVTQTAGGVIVQLLGGDKPHVGATVITHPRPSLAGGGKTSCNSIVIPELGHKEDELAKPLSEKIAVALNCTVVMVAGIHVDNAGSEEIQQIGQICHELVARFLARP
ncbi:MAG: hypothetical protein MJA84_08900 [Firmicutes bacterium]|nr:hypothetical protein [Bacillota bacterium]